MVHLREIDRIARAWHGILGGAVPINEDAACVDGYRCIKPATDSEWVLAVRSAVKLDIFDASNIRRQIF